ncbi:hypothetical protein IFM89_023210 [Coptis chinensis]|uniref:Large ribosomal subunit protein eL24-related N-terminal domain-containing protein n=1 Tax=Coptis chinensis TaxID=261450 RepID=A0A835I2P1_9MAGN|nr:hypothetical protein IFM89_023210 [Coptis chinensis]
MHKYAGASWDIVVDEATYYEKIGQEVMPVINRRPKLQKISFVAHSLGGLVARTELCRFSGAKIYPGRGIKFVCADSQVFLYLISKCKRYFYNRLKPSKLTWMATYRKQHKKELLQRL